MNGLNAGDRDPYVPTLARPVFRPIYKALLLRSFTSTNPIGTAWKDDEINTSDTGLTDILKQIWQIHPRIANHRHAEAHKAITYQESRICLRVIELCNEQNITMLPIHDSAIMKERHEYTLKAIMKRAYADLAFASVPNITKE